jgi:hypothetical protein
MQVAMTDLRLSRLFVVYPGAERYPLAKGIEVLSLAQLLRELRPRGRAK